MGGVRLTGDYRVRIYRRDQPETRRRVLVVSYPYQLQSIILKDPFVQDEDDKSEVLEGVLVCPHQKGGMGCTLNYEARLGSVEEVDSTFGGYETR